MNTDNSSMMLSSLQINLINQMIDEVAHRQLKDFGNIVSDLKPDGTLITECDRWSDREIVSGLTKITKNEGVLSEEGSKIVPNSSSYWVVDPLDGTTNFAAGIPYWAISIARIQNGIPETAFLDIPALKKRLVAIAGKGVWMNGKLITKEAKDNSSSSCVSLCSRSIRVLQTKPNKPFPGKIRLLGVSSLNMVSVCLGQTFAALEATPKIWDLAAAWLVLKELNCPIKWLNFNPSENQVGENLASKNFPLLTAKSIEQLEKLAPWADALNQD